MEIESYSDADTVKKRYRELALLYHPDRNPKNKHAEEYFKILTQGYSILSDPDKKEEYDNLLRNYYAHRAPGPVEVKPSKDEEVRQKVRRHKEHKRLEFIEAYVKAENEFSHRYRFILAVLIFSSGILMCYNNWFINLLNFNILYIVVGSFLFGLGSYMMAENVYKRRSFKKAMRIEEYGEDAGPVKLFVLLFFCTPIVFLCLMSATKAIHLKYFYNTTIAHKVVYLHEEVIYNYVVNGVEISRTSDAITPMDILLNKPIRVRYSRINPVISELIVLEDQP